MMALAAATLVTTFSYEWRPIFFFGATIAVIGSVARTKLRETPEFIQRIRAPKQAFLEKADHKTVFAMFFVFCASPVWFYFVFLYSADVLKNTFGYTAADLIRNNLIISLVLVIENIVCAQLCYRIYPLKIIKFLLGGLVLCVALFPYLLEHATNPTQVLLIQICVGLFGVGEFPASGIFYRHFPVLKRMTFLSMGFAIAKALMYIITSFGLIYLNLWMGHWGLWVLMIPSLLTFTWALKHFEKLDAPYKHQDLFQDKVHVVTENEKQNKMVA
jgi:MFS transporter, MHS family, proline/betaine transporter